MPRNQRIVYKAKKIDDLGSDDKKQDFIFCFQVITDEEIKKIGVPGNTRQENDLINDPQFTFIVGDLYPIEQRDILDVRIGRSKG
jgi:hypothetical protein